MPARKRDRRPLRCCRRPDSVKPCLGVGCCPPGYLAPTAGREAAPHWAVPRSTLASAQQRHHRAWGPSLQVRAQSLSHVQLFVTHPTDCNLPGSTVHEFFRQETEVGGHFLLQGTFPTQGSNPRSLCLLHWWMDSLSLSHLGIPRSAEGSAK